MTRKRTGGRKRMSVRRRVGKPHVAHAIGERACRLGYSVCYVSGQAVLT